MADESIRTAEDTALLLLLHDSLTHAKLSIEYGEAELELAEEMRHKAMIRLARGEKEFKRLYVELAERKIHDLGHLRTILKPVLG